MKKEPLINSYRVMLHPGEVMSKSDGDLHFISRSQLIQLYGVLQTDTVFTFDRNNPMHAAERIDKFFPDVLHLYPRRNSDYQDIHALDFATPKPFEEQPESIKKLFK